VMCYQRCKTLGLLHVCLLRKKLVGFMVVYMTCVVSLGRLYMSL
jgi:hypothetical protein